MNKFELTLVVITIGIVTLIVTGITQLYSAIDDQFDACSAQTTCHYFNTK